MKKIKAVSLVLLFLSLAFLPAPPAAALEPAQERSCRREWDGRTLNADRRREFRQTPCADSYCTIQDNKVACGSSTGSEAPGSVTPTSERTITGCGDIKTSLIDCKTSGGNPVQSLLLQIVNFLAVGVGIAVVGGIIWGGMLYASSNGDSARTKQGITVIVNAIIGLLLFIFMYAIINYLVPGGLFT